MKRKTLRRTNATAHASDRAYHVRTRSDSGPGVIAA
jgi:hypothetical protein